MSERRSPLDDRHQRANARFTEFGGWQMPVTFDSIKAEHTAVRTAAGKFDVSHMGQIAVSGPDATELMQRLTSNDIESMTVGAAQYSAITDEDGYMLDDTITFRRPDDESGTRYLFIPNAGKNEMMADRWERYRDRWELEATVTDQTEAYAMIAVQGPDAVAVLDPVVDADLDELGRFRGIDTDIASTPCFISRTGYTGEDGFEVLLDSDRASTVWDAIDCQPCGLGSRDTLRLEAGFLLAGNEFDQDTNRRTPIEAGIGFAVDTGTDFVGRDAIAAVAQSGPAEQLIGFGMLDRGVPRHGYTILDGENAIGMVTSGTVSPTLDRPIGLGYVPAGFAEPETEIAIEVRGAAKKAKIESLPFVK